jgi:hypothetical protein
MSARHELFATIQFAVPAVFFVGLMGCSASATPPAVGFEGASNGGSGAGSGMAAGSSGGTGTQSGGSSASSGAGSASGASSGATSGSGIAASGGSQSADASAAVDSGAGTTTDSATLTDSSGFLGDAIATDSGSGGGALSAILVPAQGALLGEYYGDGTVAQTDARIGRKPAIVLAYYAWTDDWAASSTTRTALADGKIPQITWEPTGIDFNNIVSGSLDATINARASGAKALGHKLFLDFAAEMNGDQAWTQGNAPLYVSAYRHIHDLFVAAGATNVIWAWCPNITDINGGNSMTMAYYPGDAYVDWTGVDGYNWGTSVAGFGWQSFQNLFANIYPLLAAKGKPILIGEMASDEVGGSKGQWIDGIIPALRSSFPLIKAFVWFDVLKERQWLINSSPGSLAAYQRMAKDPFMN